MYKTRVEAVLQRQVPALYKVLYTLVMKSFFALVVASALFFQAQASPVAVPVLEGRAEQACGFSTIALLRAYSAGATDHFYTTNAGQLESAIINEGYTSEGDAAQVFSTQVSGSVALYRLLNSVKEDHFYTTSATELNDTVANDAYTYEGIAAYVYPSSQCGAVPLYRMDNPVVTDHFYTTNVAERNNAITNLGYVDEGIAAYVEPQ